MNSTNSETKVAPLLEVEDFSLSFRVYKKGLREQRMQVIHKLNITIHRGEVVAVIGASGSGKSLLADAILAILPENAMCDGKLYYKKEILTDDRQKQLRGKEISLIPQSVNALNPLMKAGKQVRKAGGGVKSKASQRTIFERMGLPPQAEKKYPFELSGGMARRVLTATAIMDDPELIIADEPTPGLDPMSLQELRGYIRELADEGKGIMLITHDVPTALKVADRVVVMNEGETIETAAAEHFTGAGEHLREDYTKALWKALPQNEFISVNTSGEKEGQAENHQLTVRGLKYQYTNGPSLFEDFDLSVSPGEVVGLSGCSGSGKTTVAQIIAGYLKPHAGTVEIDGKDLSLSVASPVQLIWQHPEKAVNPRWRMRQVLAESGALDSELLEGLGIKNEWLDRYPSELSGGELQRFCLARALGADTEYLIADEITTMLDAITQAQIWEAVLRLTKRRNIGLLAISHDYCLLQQVSDRIINFEENVRKQ
ncbi:ABC transporter ATP-binding protein [Salimicrobium album]|uniref:Nickel import system ATP-binding protein NikD n=1 Tax=Salimicrobium album TaxID=50717 RepID=A0A1H3H4B3_9BACI|nr:ATP-binding cassette domain-containing protein [Salimicrobium album]SDY10065.1 ABC-type glutathione transport system ATPase component, contains duplicated ATPase domain [Salimicrobium album]